MEHLSQLNLDSQKCTNSEPHAYSFDSQFGIRQCFCSKYQHFRNIYCNGALTVNNAPTLNSMFTVYNRTSQTQKRHVLGPITQLVTKESLITLLVTLWEGLWGRAIAKAGAQK